MKRKIQYKGFLMALACLLLLVGIHPSYVYAEEGWPSGPQTDSPCVIVMEVQSGTVLYEKNAHEQHYPASITKIMTSLLAIENSSMDEVVTFSENAVYKTEGSSIWRDVGEEMTMEQCLYGLMLASSNDCGYAIAEHVSGTMEGFVEEMNKRAKQLGCTDTHFANPHGLTDPEHYTTCYDMALIAREAYKNEEFRKIIGTVRYTIPATNKHDEETYLKNHNEMLHPFRTNGEYQYEYCTGGKTGWTEAANSTLVTYAEKDGLQLVCVIMNTQSPSQWKDSIRLYDYCFQNFQAWNVSENEKSYEETKENGGLSDIEPYVEMDRNGVIVLPKTAQFEDAVSEVSYENQSDTVEATLKYTYEGRDVGGADIVTTNARVAGFTFHSREAATETEALTEAGEKKGIAFPVKTILLVLLGIVVLVLLGFGIRLLWDRMPLIRRKYFNGGGFHHRKYRTIKDTRKHKRRRRFKKR